MRCASWAGKDRELKIFVGVITEEAQREKRSDSLNLGNSQSYKLSYAPPEVLKVTPEEWAYRRWD